MRKPASMKALEELGRVRLSPNFFMREMLYSEISNFHGDHLSASLGGFAGKAALPEPKALVHREQKPSPEGHSLPGRRLPDALRKRTRKQRGLQQHGARNHPQRRIPPSAGRDRPL